MLEANDFAVLSSVISVHVTPIYTAEIMRDSLSLFIIEHDDDLSSYAVAYNTDPAGVVLHLHDVVELEFGLALFPTFREAKDYFNNRVAL